MSALLWMTASVAATACGSVSAAGGDIGGSEVSGGGGAANGGAAQNGSKEAGGDEAAGGDGQGANQGGGDGSGGQGGGGAVDPSNECASGTDDCSNFATCTDTPEGFLCECFPGYDGNGKSCGDLHECNLGQDDCDDNASCANTPGSFTCTCNPGYAGSGQTCEDVDECALATDSCDVNASCLNAIGDYDCACNTGYAGDGFACTDIDECNEGFDCGGHGSCTNTLGSYDCACDAGFELGSTEGSTEDATPTCIDTDECAIPEGDPGHITCATYEVCLNVPATAYCICAEGYALDAGACADIDECTEGTDDCDSDASCTNTSGAYTCACNEGFLGNGQDCIPEVGQHLAQSATHACAIKQDGTLWCWGQNLMGELGRGYTSPTPTATEATPTQVGTATDWYDIATVQRLSCGIRADDAAGQGSLWCWGNAGSFNFGSTPTQVGAAVWRKISLGGDLSTTYACGIGSDQGLWCWGYGEDGRLGTGYDPNGDLVSATEPGRVAAWENWEDVDLGKGSACAITRQGTVQCWGRNEHAEVGNWSQPGTAVLSPAPIVGQAARVSVGSQVSCARFKSGVLSCWGDNRTLELVGIPDHAGWIIQPPGYTVTEATDWLEVAVGDQHACATKTDGSMHCWGVGTNFELGTGAASSSVEPAQVLSPASAGLTGAWLWPAAGNASTCAMTDTFSVACWGDNSAAQCGIPATLGGTQESPAAVY